MIPKFWADLLSKQPTPAQPKLPGRSGMKSISEESDIRRGRLSQSSRLQHRSGKSNQRHDNNNIPTMLYGTVILKNTQSNSFIVHVYAYTDWVCLGIPDECIVGYCLTCHYPQLITAYYSPPHMCIFPLIVSWCQKSHEIWLIFRTQFNVWIHVAFHD